MALGFQLVIDSAQPHVLADWWAETLGWDVEGTDEAFIRSMVEQGFATEDDTITHHGQLKWRTGAAINHPDGKSSGHPRVLFQLVPEGKTVKNRLHLDLRPIQGDPEKQIADLEGRGATLLWRGEEGPRTRWATLADPEGNEFCVPTT
jgi:glyoxalase superfamily protein